MGLRSRSTRTNFSARDIGARHRLLVRHPRHHDRRSTPIPRSARRRTQPDPRARLRRARFRGNVRLACGARGRSWLSGEALLRIACDSGIVVAKVDRAGSVIDVGSREPSHPRSCEPCGFATAAVVVPVARIARSSRRITSSTGRRVARRRSRTCRRRIARMRSTHHIA
jgi:hypothetical protein